MSELSVRQYLHNDGSGLTLGYDKSEADKVIAEKDAEIERLKAIRKVHVEAIESMGAGLLQDEEELRHQKYKRCLAMAWFCHFIAAWDNEVYVHNGTTDDVKAQLYWKWEKRWLAIAEKFKPSSTINRKEATNAL